MWNTIIVNPMTNMLIWFYAWLWNNYFLAIVVATVLTRVLTFPLMQQQLKSASGMQELRPQLEKIQEKYKNDPEQLQRKQMELYKEAGINPLGGCLPMFIQFPILIGFYQAITRSLGASPLQLLNLSQNLYTNLPAWLPDAHNLIPLDNRFFWLNLAAPDRYYILPVLVVLSTLLYQRIITPPTTGDSQQAAMTRSMQWLSPIMIGYFSLISPSGLSIYWVTGNIIMFIQYIVTGRGSLKNIFGTEDGSFSFRGLLGLPAPEPEKGKKSSKSRRNK